MSKEGKVVGMIAHFDGPHALIKGAEAFRDAGYRKFDCHSSYPIHGMDNAMGLPPSKLGWVVMASGTLGCCVGLLTFFLEPIVS